MAEMREAGEIFALDHDLLVAAGMEAVPVAGKLAALGVELGPALLAVEGIDLFFVGAGVVVDDHVGIEAEAIVVGLGDQRLQLGAIAVECLGAALLVEVAQVKIIVWVVTHGAMVGGFRDRGKPKRIESRFAQGFDLLSNMIPPVTLLVFLLGRIPVKGLHHDGHGMFS